MTLANFQNSLSTLAPASIDKSACSPAGIMSPGLGPAELLRNCLLDWAPSGANKKRPPGLGPGSFLKKLQWGAVFLCQIEYGGEGWRCEASLECKHPVSREEGGLVPPAHSPSRNDNKQIKIMSRACVCYICVHAPIHSIISLLIFLALNPQCRQYPIFLVLNLETTCV